MSASRFPQAVSPKIHYCCGLGNTETKLDIAISMVIGRQRIYLSRAKGRKTTMLMSLCVFDATFASRSIFLLLK
jgi:hypothetical protein